MPKGLAASAFGRSLWHFNTKFSNFTIPQVQLHVYRNFLVTDVSKIDRILVEVVTSW